MAKKTHLIRNILFVAAFTDSATTAPDRVDIDPVFQHSALFSDNTINRRLYYRQSEIHYGQCRLRVNTFEGLH